MRAKQKDSENSLGTYTFAIIRVSLKEWQMAKIYVTNYGEV